MEGADDYLSTHSVVIRSPMVVARAIEAVGLEDLPSLDPVRPGPQPGRAGHPQPVGRRPDRLAKILRVDYQAGSREEAVRMVQALTAQLSDDSSRTAIRGTTTR